MTAATPVRCRIRASTTAVGRERVPLTPGQRSLWVVEQVHAGSDVNHLARLYLVHGRVAREQFLDAFVQVLRRHEMLRVRFAGSADAVHQVVPEELDLDFRFADLAGGTVEAARRQLRHEAAAPFDLRRLGAARVSVVRLAANHHLVLLALHHIAGDFLGGRIFTGEYLRFCGGDPGVAELPAARSFLEFAQVEDAAGGPERLAEGVEYFRQLLAAPVHRSRFPQLAWAHAARPGVQRSSFELDPSSVDRLAALCRAERCTLYLGLVTTLKLLLARYTGDPDVAIGTIISRRPRAFACCVGYFVNLVVLRTSIDRQASFRTTLRAVRDSVRRTRQHDDLPFGTLVERLQPERPERGHPYFSVLFNYVDRGTGDRADPAADAPGEGDLFALSEPFTAGSLAGTSEDCLPARPRFELAIHVFRHGRTVRIHFDYDGSLYDPGTLAGVAAHWRAWVDGVLAAPDSPTGAGRPADGVVLKGLDTVELPSPGVVFRRFEAARRQHPAKVAVRHAGREMTYGEFGRLVDRTALALRERGVQRGRTVAVAIERSPELLATVWAVLKAGGTFLAIDVALPPARVAVMLREAGADLLVTHGADCADWPGRTLRWSDLAPAGEPDETAWWQCQPGDVAYVVFTSGSTGVPKGAANTHGGLANLLSWMPRELGFSAEDVFAQRTSVAFDVSVWEMLLPLMLGATTAILPAAALLDLPALGDHLREERITVMHFVPSLLRAFLLSCPRSALPPALRVVLCGGEKLDQRLCADFFAGFGRGVRLWNMYGPAEATIDVATQEIRPDDTFLPIGRPVPHVRLYILDDELQPCPQGATGELCVAGVQVGKGYVNQPELTARRFVRLPATGELVYRTGDLARRHPAGEIEYLGRHDRQVKIRGVRVELEEIEHALLGLPAVRAAAVLAAPDTDGFLQLEAHLELAHPLEEARLREQLGARLPAGLLPGRIRVVPALPRLLSGKVDRQRLGSLALTAPPSAPADEVAAPGAEDPVMAEVAAAFRAVLRCGRVEPHAHFFALGGHSLQLVQLAHQLEQATGVRLSLAEVIARPTVAALAALVAGRRPAAPVGETSAEISGVI